MTGPELARVAVERHGETMLARLAGEIDLSNAVTVEDQVTRGLYGATAVAVDLAGLDYLDSAGLALLVLLASEPQPRARSRAKLALTCVTLAVLLALTSFAIDRG